MKGAYFNRSLELRDSIFEPFNAWDAVMWAGAGGAFALAAVVVLASRRLR